MPITLYTITTMKNKQFVKNCLNSRGVNENRVI